MLQLPKEITHQQAAVCVRQLTQQMNELFHLQAQTEAHLDSSKKQSEELAFKNSQNNSKESKTDLVLLDASPMVLFDSSALAVLLACRRHALAAGKIFAVRGLSPRLAGLAQLYGVAELLPCA